MRMLRSAERQVPGPAIFDAPGQARLPTAAPTCQAARTVTQGRGLGRCAPSRRSRWLVRLARQRALVTGASVVDTHLAV
jgi:hypothetical protein